MGSQVPYLAQAIGLSAVVHPTALKIVLTTPVPTVAGSSCGAANDLPQGGGIQPPHPAIAPPLVVVVQSFSATTHSSAQLMCTVLN